jgi:hypothetical protein
MLSGLRESMQVVKLLMSHDGPVCPSVPITRIANEKDILCVVAGLAVDGL